MTRKEIEIKAQVIDILVPIKEEQVFSDWRLPTIEELITLVNYNKINPACKLEDTEAGCYWSSTPNALNFRDAWFVGFYYGSINLGNKSNFFLVRCVRDGENGLEWSAISEKSMNWDKAVEYAKNLVAPVYYKEK